MIPSNSLPSPFFSWRQFWRSFLILSLLLSIGSQSSTASDDAEEKEQCDDPVEQESKIRLVTLEELSTKTGGEDNPGEIWLSIMGEVYDVRAGSDFYGPGGGYSAFAGRDASVPFITGTFTAEEAKKDTEALSMQDLIGLLDWRSFYHDHGVYQFVGRLVDPRFYDTNGNPTPTMEVLQQRLATMEAGLGSGGETKKKASVS